MAKDVIGSVMVVGGGIAGIQASLDMADSGYLVHMVEKKSAIGGVMAQLDKTFPTNDCSMCIISPKDRVPVRCLDPKARECNFLEVSLGYNEAEAQEESQRCLRCGICSECYQCVKACLAGGHRPHPEGGDRGGRGGFGHPRARIQAVRPVALRFLQLQQPSQRPHQSRVRTRTLRLGTLPGPPRKANRSEIRLDLNFAHPILFCIKFKKIRLNRQ